MTMSPGSINTSEMMYSACCEPVVMTMSPGVSAISPADLFSIASTWRRALRRSSAKPRVVSYCMAARPRTVSPRIVWLIPAHDSVGSVCESTSPAAKLTSDGSAMAAAISALIGCSLVRRALEENASGRCELWGEWDRLDCMNAINAIRRRGAVQFDQACCVAR